MTTLPFGRGLAPGMLFRSDDHAQAVAHIGYGIATRGITVVTGEVGVGKTVAARAAIDRAEPARQLPGQPVGERRTVGEAGGEDPLRVGTPVADQVVEQGRDEPHIVGAAAGRVPPVAEALGVRDQEALPVGQRREPADLLRVVAGAGLAVEGEHQRQRLARGVAGRGVQPVVPAQAVVRQGQRVVARPGVLGRQAGVDGVAVLLLLLVAVAFAAWSLGGRGFGRRSRLGFGAVGMALTSFVKSWQQLEWINTAILPMFLFSTTFYPLDVYPPVIAAIVRCLPLYQGIELMRGLCLGIVSPSLLWHVLYFLVMAAVRIIVTSRRLDRLLLR